MPKEIYSPLEYEKYKKYLQGPLKQIKNLDTSRSHTTIAYWVKPTSENEAHVCDDCGRRALFLLYDKDHLAQTSINLYCSSHANPAFHEWLKESDF